MTTNSGTEGGAAVGCSAWLGRDHIGKRVLFHDDSNDAVRQTCVRRVSPNGAWAYCSGDGIYDDLLRWVRCKTITVVDVLGPADGYESEITSPLCLQMREEYRASRPNDPSSATGPATPPERKEDSR